jgi:outer membrane protein OmpA-like peptidoglycan-associated protein
MANLFDTILSSLPANTGDALGALLGDNPDASFKGLSAILPLLLASFAGKAASGGDLGGLMSTITGGLAGGNPLDNPAALFGGAPQTGGLSGLASQLLGANAGPVAATIAQLFGLKGSTVNSLMALAGPLLAGGLGKVLGAAPSVPGLRNLLVTEKDSYEAALPAELRNLISPMAAAAPAAPVVEDVAAGGGWWKWLLLGAALLGLLWYFFFRGHKEEAVAPAAVEPAVMETAPVAPVVPTGAGVLAEERAGRPVLVVFFDVGKSEVTNDLAAASAAVKAYADSHPDAKLSVSGYNDPTGDAAANAALSKSRAEQVKAALVATGIAAERVDLDKPVAPTDTTESYAAARRVEVTVKE